MKRPLLSLPAPLALLLGLAQCLVGALRSLTAGLVLALLTVLPVAHAQGAGDGAGWFDPEGWGSSPFAFATFIVLAVATVKKAAEQAQLGKYGTVIKQPWLWRGLAALIGVGGSFGLHAGGYGAELPIFGLVAPWTVVAFGLVATVSATGFRDFAVALLGVLGKAVASRPAEPAGALPPEVQPPAGVKQPGPQVTTPLVAPATPAGIPGLDLDFGTSARGLMGAGAAGEALTVAIKSPLVQAIAENMLRGAGLPVHAVALGAVALRLLPVAPDLLEDDPYLEERSLALLNRVILDLKREGLK